MVYNLTLGLSSDLLDSFALSCTKVMLFFMYLLLAPWKAESIPTSINLKLVQMSKQIMSHLNGKVWTYYSHHGTLCGEHSDTQAHRNWLEWRQVLGALLLQWGLDWPLGFPSTIFVVPIQHRGKELLGFLIHLMSYRAKGNWVEMGLESVNSQSIKNRVRFCLASCMLYILLSTG